MRCGIEKCRHRFTLRKHPQEYKRSPKCPKCGDVNKVRSVEAERLRELEKKVICNCYAYPFPHQAASLKACKVSVDMGVVMNEDDWEDYQATLDTPRGA